jgi:hypothetical protein
MFTPFHLLKTYIRNPSMLFISFFTPPTGVAVHICAWRGLRCQLTLDVKLFCQKIESQFFLFCQNYIDAKLR